MRTNKSNSKFWLLGILCLLSVTSYCQGDPTDSLPGDPGALYTYTIQNMSFGSFAQGASGGTLTLSNTGTRTATGTVLPLNVGPVYQAIFEVECPPYSIISVTNGPSAVLTGSNGGTITLNIGAASPASPFLTTVAPPARTEVHIGGTLTIGNPTASPPGTYTGSFYVIFDLQ